MTGDTVTGADWSMLKFFGKNSLVMTVKTERTDSFAFFPFELEFEGRLVRIMTYRTAFLNRGMHNLLVKFLFLGLVADHAHAAVITGKLFFTKTAVRVVTRNTDTSAYRAVHILLGCHFVAMTFVRCTVGSGRHVAGKVKRAAPELVAILTVHLLDAGMHIITLISLWLLIPVIDLDRGTEFTG